jgi:hypothetical protein
MVTSDAVPPSASEPTAYAIGAVWFDAALAYWPVRSPSSGWSRWPGGTRRSSMGVAASTAESLRTARRAMSGGNRRSVPFTHNGSVRLSANDRVTTFL